MSKLGERLIDERLTISSDPMDPDIGVPPFIFNLWTDWRNQYVYHPAVWFKNGVLNALAYNRDYAVEELGVPNGLPNPGAYRMSGGTTTVEEMIASTTRGLLVTRFDLVRTLDITSVLLRGYTRDGLWLIEHGKISHPVKNMVFTESGFFVLNHVEQLGVPQRVFHPAYGTEAPHPVVVPPLKISDFSFTALTDAI